MNGAPMAPDSESQLMGAKNASLDLEGPHQKAGGPWHYSPAASLTMGEAG